MEGGAHTGAQTLDGFLVVEVAVLVKLPHLLAHLQKDVKLGRLGAEDGLGVARDDAGLGLVALDVHLLDRGADALDVDALLVVQALADQLPAQAPHVAAAQVLVQSTPTHARVVMRVREGHGGRVARADAAGAAVYLVLERELHKVQLDKLGAHLADEQGGPWHGHGPRHR